MSEKKLEECSLEEATHIEVNSKMYKLGGYEVVREYYRNDCIGLRWYEWDAFIPKELFPILGIKTLFEHKPELIEFDGKWRTLYLGDNHLPYENSKKAKFKCIEILEDEE